jgi:hypothetical protein
MCLFVCVLTAAGCTTTKGSGNITTETRTIKGVNSVSLLGDGRLEIEQTGTESLTITADDNILPLLSSDVRDGDLKLGVKNLANTKPTQGIRYKLTVKGLTGLSLTGDADAEVTKLATERLTTSIMGDAKIRIDGTADQQEISITGDGKYDGTGLTSKTAKVSITGDGKLDIDVSDSLDIKILGDGTINYTGDPKISKTVLGDGHINKR